MRKINLNQSKAANFLRGKGFYAALCLSIAAVGAAGFFAYRQTADKLKNQLENLSSAQTTAPQEWGYDDLAENANADKNNVPLETSQTQPEETAPPETEAKAESKPDAEQVSAQPFIMPISGEVINAFSNGELVKSKTLNCWKTHDGVDIKADIGAQVKAMTSGTVTDVKEDALWGVCVVIDHGNGFEGWYCNLNKVIPVKVGQKVSAGTVIGAVGDTALCEVSEDSHLHFGLKKDGAWVDPIATIQGN